MFSKVLVPQILVIEKNDQILDILTSCIGTSGTTIEHVTEMRMVKDKSLAKYSLIIADLKLKEQNTIALIKGIREKDIFTPIILLGDNYLPNKILAYELGINMYHEKPITCELLKVQIKNLSLLYRNNIQLDLGILKIDMSAKGIICESGFVPFTSREFNLLMLLIRAGGRVLSPSQIAELSPCEGEEITESAIHTIVSRIRTKLKNKIPEPLILTRHQAGYGINHQYLQNFRFKIDS